MPKRPLDLWCISVPVTPESEEPTVALVERVAKEAPTVYLDADSGRRWVSAYLNQPLRPRQRAGLLNGLSSLKDWGVPVASGELICRRVRRQDWAHAWKHHFHPIRIGRQLIVKPSWRRVAKRPNQKVIVLDPGLAFGTGHHPTTAFCLEEIVRFRPQSSQAASFLDVGTGSGILAIAAAKLGYTPVRAFDIGADSVAIAKANARRNRVDHKIHLKCASLESWPIRSRKGYDLVCANLVSDLLCAQGRRLLGQVAKGGRLVLAGILDRQFAGVRRSFEKLGMGMESTKVVGEWRCGTFQIPLD